MKCTLAALSTSLMLLAAPASAVTIAFEDDFSGYGSTTVLNAEDSVFGGNWKTTSGTVDYLAEGSDFDGLCPDGTNCVDLDGSTGDAGVFETVQTFGAGVYNLLFQISGNNRGAADDLVTITFGNLVHIFSIASGAVASQADFGSLFFGITVTTPTTLSFANAGGDNIGAILKTVVVENAPAPVPVPAAGWLLALGLGALAMMRRQKLSAV